MPKYSFSCASVGMNCGFEIVNADSEEELLEMLKIHAKSSHGVTSIPPELLAKIKQNIKKAGKYSFSCASVGMNCGFEIVNADSEEELLDELMVHAKMSHNLSSIPPDTLNKIKQNIKVM
ncbi:DUF1059 domain-containing protein [Sulfolobus sp. S-194]|uniref:DUF1059 domain-containing protein n=1 Tax=Sulfolobus sp. S-194 TaxID=2512240 RepID=UPI001436FB5F|nr:DUF1059 domain-containing protein [Sulfolobus sp. S-194]QIW24471.1 DUF1059 domain-containing protein [Sulfolobus sp. S-194]